MNQKGGESYAEDYECPFCHKRARATISTIGVAATLLHRCRVARRDMPMPRREPDPKPDTREVF